MMYFFARARAKTGFALMFFPKKKPTVDFTSHDVNRDVERWTEANVELAYGLKCVCFVKIRQVKLCMQMLQPRAGTMHTANTYAMKFVRIWSSHSLHRPLRQGEL